MKAEKIIQIGMIAAGLVSSAVGAKVYVDQQAINQKLNAEIGRLTARVEAGSAVDRITITQVCQTQQAVGGLDPRIDCAALADVVVNSARSKVTPMPPLDPVPTPELRTLSDETS